MIALLWASVRTLAGDAPITLEEAIALASPSTVEEQKRAVLQALKDLEYERSIGKISEPDYEELVVATAPKPSVFSARSTKSRPAAGAAASAYVEKSSVALDRAPAEEPRAEPKKQPCALARAAKPTTTATPYFARSAGASSGPPRSGRMRPCKVRSAAIVAAFVLFGAPVAHGPWARGARRRTCGFAASRPGAKLPAPGHPPTVRQRPGHPATDPGDDEADEELPPGHPPRALPKRNRGEQRRPEDSPTSTLTALGVIAVEVLDLLRTTGAPRRCDAGHLAAIGRKG